MTAGSIWFWWGWACFIGWGITLWFFNKHHKDFNRLLKTAESFKRIIEGDQRYINRLTDPKSSSVLDSMEQKG